MIQRPHGTFREGMGIVRHFNQSNPAAFGILLPHELQPLSRYFSHFTFQMCIRDSPKWSSVKKWLLHINYAPGYAPEPEQKPVCRQFSRCEGCPYPAHGFLCWGGEDDCMRTRVKKLNEKELEHEDQSGFV